MHGGAFMYQRHQRQGETEEENGDDEGDGDDYECRRCSDGFVHEYLSK